MHRALIPPQLEQWARRAISKLAAANPTKPASLRRRALLVHIDGVSNATLEQGLSSGRMPFVSSMLSSHAYLRDGAFWGAPPSTPVFEASAIGAAAPAGGTVGFSWEAGTHGGLTVAETDSFVIWPRGAPASLDSLDHAVGLHSRICEGYGD